MHVRVCLDMRSSNTEQFERPAFMRTLSIRQFRANMAQELKNLPFALTRQGETIACVVSQVYTTSQGVHKEPDKACTQQDAGVHKLHVINEADSISEQTYKAIVDGDPFFRPHSKDQQTRKKGKQCKQPNNS